MSDIEIIRMFPDVICLALAITTLYANHKDSIIRDELFCFTLIVSIFYSLPIFLNIILSLLIK